MEMNGMQRVTKTAAVAMGLAVVTLAAACGSSGSSSGGGTSTVLNGAGSTLVAPLISQWEPDYAKSAGITITYGAVGSGGGVDAITNRTVDFGASDAPLSSRPGHRLQELPADPVGAGSDGRDLQREGRSRQAEADGAGARRHLPRRRSPPGTTPAIASLNPGVNLPDHAHHADLPQRRLR